MLPRIKCLPLLLMLLVKSSDQYSSGAPEKACLDQLPRHESIPPQASAVPYMIATSTAQVRQGDTLNVTIGSPAGAPLPIGGFLLQAREIQDPEKIVGKFVSVPNTETTHLTSCSGGNDTATHSNPKDKPALTFQWQAPPDFLGGIEFRATIAQSYATFWSNIRSPLVEVVPRDAVVSAPPPGRAPPPRTQPPPVIMENKPKEEPRPLDTIYQGCADTKLCFGVPQNCIPKGDCQAVLAVFVAGDTYTFELQASGNPRYVAAGLSNDNKMGDDSAMECVRNDNGRINVFTSWTYPKAEPYVRRSDSPQGIVQPLESSLIDGKLYCKFRRDAISVVKEQTFDLAGQMYNLMIVAGSSMKDADRVGFHDLAYEATGVPQALASVGTAAAGSKVLIKLHGCFMLLAWLGSASLGILLARYFRQTWVGKQLGGKDIWFAWHRILMVGTWLLTVIGFVLILVEVGGWSATGENLHAYTGIITVVLCFIQPIGAYFRPHPGTEKRAIFNWAHWAVGNAAHILAIVTIIFAVYLPKAELPSWSLYILVVFVVFHVVMHLVLTLTVCASDGRIGAGRVEALAMKDLRGQTRRATHVDGTGDAPFSSFRKFVLAIYSPVTLIIVIAMICLVALAPIQQAYETIAGP